MGAWRCNAPRNYNFVEGRVKNFGVGGAVRWEGKTAIGFAGGTNPSAENVRGLFYARRGVMCHGLSDAECPCFTILPF